MAAPRSTSLRALRALSQQHATAPSSSFRRSLHITGAFSAQPANPADKTSLYAARSLADLKAECQRRSLRTTGSKNEVCYAPHTTEAGLCLPPSGSHAPPIFQYKAIAIQSNGITDIL